MTTTTSREVFARDLKEGDVIDLAPAVIKFCPEIDAEHDISAYELATVEFVVRHAAYVIVGTDQHNISVFPSFAFETQEN